MIHFAVFAANVFFFNPNISETKQARLLKFFNDREANNLEKKFSKKCKSFDVAYLLLRVGFHSSWAFFE